MAAGGAHDAAIAEPPASAVAALRAHEPLWPSHPLEVVETVGIGTEPSLELAHGPRVVHAATGPGHPANLLRLNGDPQPSLCAADGNSVLGSCRAQIVRFCRCGLPILTPGPQAPPAR